MARVGPVDGATERHRHVADAAGIFRTGRAFALWGAKVAGSLGVDVGSWAFWQMPANAKALAAPVWEGFKQKISPNQFSKKNST